MKNKSRKRFRAKKAASSQLLNVSGELQLLFLVQAGESKGKSWEATS